MITRYIYGGQKKKMKIVKRFSLLGLSSTSWFVKTILVALKPYTNKPTYHHGSLNRPTA